MAERFSARTRDEWARIFHGTDACVTPVLTYHEALSYPHLVQRGTFERVSGIDMPRPAPRFSRTDPSTPLLASGSSDLSMIVKEWKAS